ncbi:MAG: type IV conjugative transfer system protein TraE [Deferribacteraceae bacterium]|jgi:type IV conjugative transfer system protein TraE|nr:type IV conjugative transfer system protein TraE [Deferribacteraceae bacterium]
MTTKRYVSSMANLSTRNKFNTIIIAILVSATLILSINVVLISKQQKVILIPQGINQNITVGHNFASEEYLLAMGNYVTFLFLNFDETTVVSQYDMLSGLSSGVVRTETVQLAEDYKKNHISSRVLVQKIEATDKNVTVIGRRTKYIMDKAVEETNFTLVIRYSITFGTFRVDELRFI